MIDFERLGKTVKLCTRGGLEVVSWRVQEDTPDTFFPIRATIKLEDGTTTEVSYNRNGRRFINTESEWDLEAVRLQRRDSSIEKLDTMPDVMRAIECVRKKDFLGIRSANKYSTSTNTEKLRYNYIIGTSDEGLG